MRLRLREPAQVLAYSAHAQDWCQWIRITLNIDAFVIYRFLFIIQKQRYHRVLLLVSGQLNIFYSNLESAIMIRYGMDNVTNVPLVGAGN